ncbi:MAG: hypothetical protein HFE75_07470 [Firmicutes bacterium]|jgi:hypothetical protein|nr:hypothetical protein [Bacillota bacterium]
MKQKAVVMATTFTMLLAVGVIGLGGETLHQHPAYANQTAGVRTQQVLSLSAPATETLLLTASTQGEDK